ncbi:MAG: ribose-phosphate pyrophosphokinase [Candidatus Aenigmarchaeota archaeon]|nr:ribose-phosphate pyrophosphokinase [Candidatus Aenigmarchaeota archaeon]
MIVIPGVGYSKLASKIAGELGVKTAGVSVKKFADGETYVRIDADLDKEEAVIVKSAYPGQNDSIIEAAFLAGAARNAGASTVTVVMPYVAYSRQNKIFQKGETASLDTVIKFFKASGVSRLITVDAHFYRRVGSFDMGGLEIANLSAAKLLLDYAKGKMGGEVFVIGPDFGSSEMIQYATGKLNVMSKEKICPNCGAPAAECRCGGTLKEYSVSGISSNADFAGKNVVIMDDMIVSGSTMIRAAEKVKSEGAKGVSAVATHGLFLGDSLNELKSRTDLLAVSDSIMTDASSVSISSLVAEALARA